MMMLSWLLRLLLVGVCAICRAESVVETIEETCEDGVCTDASNSSVSENAVKDLIEWIRSSGGFVHDGQEVMPQSPDDPSSSLGAFATQKIKQGQVLLTIPNELTIRPEREPDVRSDLTCETVRALLKEIQLGESSKFAPYVQHLLQLYEPGAMAEEFSLAGLNLLADILGDRLPPQDVKYGWQDEWDNVCNGGTDPNEIEAVLITVRAAEEEALIPFYDFYTHRNGNWLNTQFTRTDTGYKVTASRDIEAGEPIHNSFNMCSHCGERAISRYGTGDIFRDYGLVEQMPQRWIFSQGGEGQEQMTFDLEEHSSIGKLRVFLQSPVEPSASDAAVFRQELDRIQLIAKSERTEFSRIPSLESNTIWKYYDALELALKTIVEAIDDDSFIERNGNPRRTDAESLYYNNFDICYTDKHHMNLTGFDYDDFSKDERSVYQAMSFYEKPDTKDVCFDLENTVQICANYRPHYHEPFVHFSSAFLKDLRRVVFVGGGDSMLLHEVLKYPNIELVAGLELDQKVVRNSFKYFNTQPHFDDKRVQWWFGDATKSMTMVPQEWYGSFDLVLVDLSETVMSFAVTDQLDMVEALALLVKPDGIFIKNEHYFDKLSTIFDYTTWLVLDDTPMICKQDFIMASNRIDFLHPNFDLLKNQNIETLLYKPLENPKDHYDLFWKYAKNDAVADGKCEPRDEILFDPDKQRRAGLLLVLEAEEATAPLEPVELVEETLRQALQNAGLTPKSAVTRPSTHGGSSVVVVMKEGYVVAHTWPEYNYCALDIQLWAAFEKIETIESSLVMFMGSKEENASSFRVVAGGMLGTDTWKEDLAKIGPRYVNYRNCEERTSLDQIALPTTQTLIEESLNLVTDKDMLVVVLCGNSVEGSCASLEAVKKDKAFSKIVALWTCPSSDDDVPTSVDTNDRMKNIVICGESSTLALTQVVEETEKIGVFIVDPSASSVLVNDAKTIWVDVKLGVELVNPDVLLIIPGLDAGRDALLTSSMYMLYHEHVEGVIYTASTSPEKKVTVGLMASNRTGFLSEVVDLTSKISEDTGANAFVSGIKGDLRTDTSHQYPHHFTIDDYPTLPALQQFSEQRPLASQTIFQLDRADGHENDAISQSQLVNALDFALEPFNDSVDANNVFADLGTGILLVHVWAEGHMIVLWDGSSRVDLNILTYDESVDHKSKLADPFMKKIGDMKLLLQDEQPRGTGRVVNFLKQAGTRTPGCWDSYAVRCLHFAKAGDCDTNDVWMGENCRKACGLCE